MQPLCPVCGKSRVGGFQTCPVCEWSNDPAQRHNPDLRDMDNEMSLNEARAAYKAGKEVR